MTTKWNSSYLEYHNNCKVGNISSEDVIHNVPAVKNLSMFLDVELKTHYSHKQTHKQFLQHPTQHCSCSVSFKWGNNKNTGSSTYPLENRLLLKFVPRNTKVQYSKVTMDSEHVLQNNYSTAKTLKYQQLSSTTPLAENPRKHNLQSYYNYVKVYS